MSNVQHPSHYQNGLGVEVIDIINEYFRDSYNLVTSSSTYCAQTRRAIVRRTWRRRFST